MKNETRFCSECGAPLEESDRFCPVCGAKVPEVKKKQKNEPPATEREHKHNEASTKESSSNNSALWLILGIVILIIIGGSYIFMEQQNQSRYVKSDKNEAPKTNYFTETSLATPETDAESITLLGETYDPKLSSKAVNKMIMTTTNGKKLHITGTERGLIFEEFKGKIIFLKFFGHKCTPCINSIPYYNKLQNKYKNKIKIIAIELQRFDNAQLKNFVKAKGINYITISQYQAEKFIPYISARAQWQGKLPFIVAMSTNGNVEFVHQGVLSENDLENLVNKLSE